jgi:hypothetical protein
MDTDCIWKFQHYSSVCYHLTRPTLPPPLIIFSHIYYITIYVFSHIFKIKWFCQKYIHYKNRSKFSKFNFKKNFFGGIEFLVFLEIIADEMLTTKIEAIEDALGNEVYFYSLKTDRKQIDRQNDLKEGRVYGFFFPKNKIKILFRHSPQEIVLNKIKTLENQIQTIQTQVKFRVNV